MALDDRLLSGVSVLAAVVEADSFVRAAEILGITQPAVSRAIARLEARIGVRLLDRTTRSVTSPKTVAASTKRLAPSSPASATPSPSPLARPPSFAVASASTWTHTSQACFSPRTWAASSTSTGFDLAIRFAELPSSSLVARRLLDTRVVTVAAPSYLAKHGRPAKPTDVSSHVCLQFRNPVTGSPFEWEFHRGRKVLPIKTTGRLLLTDAQTLVRACIAGAGIAQLLAIAIQDNLDRGDLIELFPDWPDERFPLYALYPSRHLPPAKLRAFIDFVLQVAVPTRP